ncbi:N-formylglutamate amidohydrolase [Sphingobium sp. CCH11-B1]|jgi:predicted N-formylglutamate amidohydrolase|uniref:N-formylglutamate amidohydrolase n=1 Tax=Sphingobium sp. CCH11-B1 TaxID=1768781 RepID=UPI0008325093|nr:N-formylglutamate amidohydrolase [Sphingobium sp. CCH11-B1]MEA3389859.1 N-formylglutamate amidohydrolase [Pseudomonadota bacterium]
MAWNGILTVGRAVDELLGPEDPAPFTLFNAGGTAPFLLIGDHAGSAIPRALGDLGLEPVDRKRHIALDIGVLGMGEKLALLLDAPFLHQTYSRLVVDCNRDPDRPDAMPAVSDGTRIAGNEGLDAVARQARIEEIHRPYHAALAANIEARLAAGRQAILLSLHSFTPIMNGMTRPWEIGILYCHGRPGIAVAMLHALGQRGDIMIGDNEPYAMDDTDYTIPRHAISRALRYAEIEVRQDLISTEAGQHVWAQRLAGAILAAASA